MKDWWEYTDKEKSELKSYWTDERIKEVVDSLKEKKNLPDFVNLVPLRDEVSDSISGEELKKAASISYDLRGIVLRKHGLDEIDLRYANLQGSDLSEANLQNAELQGTNLQGSVLEGATLDNVNFYNADLRETNLKKTKLNWAKFKSTRLEGADFSDALFNSFLEVDLYHSFFSNTLVEVEELKKAKNYRYIQKGDGRFRSDWDLEKVENLHRDVKNFFQKEGMRDMEKEYHYWENEARTRRFSWFRFHLEMRFTRLLFLQFTYGYSSRLNWLIRYTFYVIILFGLIFFYLTLRSKRKPEKRKSGIYLVQTRNGKSVQILLPFGQFRSFFECLFFSALSFLTFGYGPLQLRQWLEFFHLEKLEYKPVRWARFFLWLEAALGIWVLALLVTGLFGK